MEPTIIASSTPFVAAAAQSASSGVSFVIEQIRYWASFIASTTIAIAALGGVFTFVYKMFTGGFHSFKFLKKFNKFIDRVDGIVDDIFPEVLGALEKKNLVATGTSAKWTSLQAKILKAQSPIQITLVGNEILKEIIPESDYAKYALEIKQRILKELPEAITEFDLEQVAIRTGGLLFDEGHPLLQGAKEYLFNHPKMAQAEMKSLVGIYLRDKMTADQEVIARLKQSS